MSKLPAPSRRDGDVRTVVVRRPRASDGVGSALRNAYAGTAQEAPAEWTLLIERIDKAR